MTEMIKYNQQELLKQRLPDHPLSNGYRYNEQHHGLMSCSSTLTEKNVSLTKSHTPMKPSPTMPSNHQTGAQTQSPPLSTSFSPTSPANINQQDHHKREHENDGRKLPMGKPQTNKRVPSIPVPANCMTCDQSFSSSLSPTISSDKNQPNHHKGDCVIETKNDEGNQSISNPRNRKRDLSFPNPSNCSTFNQYLLTLKDYLSGLEGFGYEEQSIAEQLYQFLVQSEYSVSFLHQLKRQNKRTGSSSLSDIVSALEQCDMLNAMQSPEERFRNLKIKGGENWESFLLRCEQHCEAVPFYQDDKEMQWFQVKRQFLEGANIHGKLYDQLSPMPNRREFLALCMNTRKKVRGNGTSFMAARNIDQKSQNHQKNVTTERNFDRIGQRWHLHSTPMPYHSSMNLTPARTKRFSPMHGASSSHYFATNSDDRPPPLMSLSLTAKT